MKEYTIDKDQIIKALVNKGFVKLPSIKNFINVSDLSERVSLEVGEKNFVESSSFHLELIKKLGINHSLVPILYDLAKERLNYMGDLSNQYHVSRKVSPGDSKECYRAHFDSHLFTIVFPLIIPASKNQEPAGELIIFPSLRKNPKYELQNLISKIWFKKYASKKKLEQLSASKEMVLIDFQDYCPLIFRGNTFLHTNRELSSSVDHYRLTCLSHFFDPFPSLGIGSILRKIRSR